MPEDSAETNDPAQNSASSMQEYYRLQQELYIATAVLTGIIFISAWFAYSLNTALNYLLGACTGVVYLRMLAKDVERLGKENSKIGKTRFALFIGLFILATRLDQLEIIPIFLGFLTYKAALIIYTLRITFLPDSR
ncbi:ATP synthase subunit I [Geitlerinema sp. PCC 7407]|uniref:ATP synthase subunit I n=1 Tax=Geitlerinema sp. PCC 7407 TaxID=1173025 RepID=UPI00029FA574|nr:ATP synthase subunit I [Geitlerinema sp. PCC 7407]AFY66834.1 hypothetical protein GEI7407_2359 [Geitlerinema sp. PCC 7407]